MTSPEPRQRTDRDPGARPKDTAPPLGGQREHTLAVAAHARDLTNRMTAALALGTLTGALQPLEAHRW